MAAIMGATASLASSSSCKCHVILGNQLLTAAQQGCREHVKAWLDADINQITTTSLFTGQSPIHLACQVR
jgi:hypothetical protein